MIVLLVEDIENTYAITNRFYCVNDYITCPISK